MKLFLNPLQRTGTFTSLYLIIKYEVFPWFGPSGFIRVVSSVRLISMYVSTMLPHESIA
jgi:hypothetical protein